MARTRSPLRDKAYALWLESDKTRTAKSIADELGTSASQVSKWKSEDNWTGESKSKSKGKSKRSTKSKSKSKGPGAPLGNKNAEGHGAPPGNANAIKHGAYSNIMLGLLDEDEAAAFADASTGTDPEAEIRQTLALLNAKEIRLTKYIARLREQIKTDDLLETITSDTSKGTDVFNCKHNGKIRVNPIEGIAKLEAELDKVHGRKTRALEALERIREFNLTREDKRAAEEKSDTSDWIAMVETAYNYSAADEGLES